MAIGVAGLAGLFGGCVEAIEHFNFYKSSGYESSYVTAPFAANKLLFQRWADVVGIAGGELNDVHHIDLDNVEVASVVGRMLSCIHGIFGQTDSVSSKLTIKSIDDEISSFSRMHSTSGKKLFGTKNSHASASRRDRVFWAFGRQEKFHWAS